MADVFISYARSEQALAARVAKGLGAAGFNVWWDADLPAHRAYSEEIERNLEDARAVVVLWSKTAAQSEWVRAEADVARKSRKLVQASVDGSIPPLPFNQIQCADLKGWRGAASHAGWSKLQASVHALVSSDKPAAASVRLPWAERLSAIRWPIAAALALAVAAMALFFMFAKPGEERKPVLAVLPFRSISAQDESLVAGIWEDTRQAIGQNPQIVVLGPNTVEQLATKGDAATKKAADYMLQASVRTAGDRIRVSANLVRTKDGEQMWTEDFDRRLDDVFALQSQIAGEIEGHIRGRLAEKGGVKPEHIATSGEVYSLYADARAKIRKRQWGEEAVDQLLQVVKLDPNFAPGWAALAEATQLGGERGGIAPPEQLARRAVELAPNLAAAHAVLALTLHLKGPVARSELERAVALDPNDYEAFNWLGNLRSNIGDRKGSLEAWSRAAEIEPLFWPAVANKFKTLLQIGDRKAIDEFKESEKQLDGAEFAIAMEMLEAAERRDLARTMNLGLAYRVSDSKAHSNAIDSLLFDPILHLGFEDLSLKLGLLPPFGPHLWRNEPQGVEMVDAMHLDWRHLLSLSPLAENYLRAAMLTGSSRKVSDLYLSAGLDPEMLANIQNESQFLVTAPMFALALRDNGHREQAAQLLTLAETKANEMPAVERNRTMFLARVYAVQGRNDEALAQLSLAAARGWLPDVAFLQADLNKDPTLESLRGDQRFRKAREATLGALARQRAQVDMNLVRRAGGP